ncbi:uncharacterized protein K452DRAFT_313875 [Neofusicoccum parvum]|nr:uncharacterized protein K452DRAFT_313875 [Neofusicoccum parvum]
MTIDVRNPTIALQESIVASLLVCDWNVRAWTLLEAVKGDKNMHLLCKDNRVLRLADILRTIHEEGSVDLINTYLSAHHLIPRAGRRDDGGLKVYNSRDSSFMITLRAFSLEEAASLLSHRHASRGGDEVVIWSILVEWPEICYKAERFWKYPTSIRTGFLMSHAPRVRGKKGLSWAPSRPDLLLQKPKDQPGDEQQFHSYPGDGSTLGEVSDAGLLASWMAFQVNHAAGFWTCLLRYLSSLLEGTMLVLSGTFGKWLQGTMAYVNQGSLDHITRVSAYWFEMMFMASATKKLYAQYVANLTTEARHIAFIRPMRDMTGEVLPYLYSGDAERVLLAVISSDTGESWVWQGVVEWDKTVPLPPFINKRFLIE